VIARLRRPVRLLECPDRASLLRPGGLPQGSAHPAAGAGTGFMRLSGRLGFSPSGDWDSGNPAFAISRGSPGAPSRTPRQRPPVSWHAIVPGFLSDHGSAIRSKDTSSSPCPLCGLYSSAPRGARRTSRSARRPGRAQLAPNSSISVTCVLHVWRATTVRESRRSAPVSDEASMMSIPASGLHQDQFVERRS